MLGDAANSYNPIIQAMIATANLKQRGQQQEIDKEKNKAEEAYRKEQLKQSLQILENVNKHATAQDEARAMEAQAQLHRAKADVAHTYATMHMQGTPDPAALVDVISKRFAPYASGAAATNPQTQNPNLFSQQPTAPPVNPEMPDLVGGQPQPQGPTNTVATPTAQPTPDELYGNPTAVREAAGAAEAKSAGLKKTAELGAAEPFTIAAEARHVKNLRDISKFETEDKKDLKKYESTLLDADKALDRKSHELIAQIGAAAKVKNPAISPETFQSLFKLKALGQIKLNPANPTHEAVLAALEQQGANVDFDSKDVDAVKETNKLGPIFDQMEKFSDKLATSRPGAFVQGAVAKGTEALGGSSELLNEWKILRSRAILVGRALEGMTGRPLAVQLATDLKSLPEAGITKKDALDRVANLRVLLQGAESSLLAGMPDWQEKMVRGAYQKTPQTADPDFLKLAPKVNKKGHKLDKEESIKAGHAVYGEQ